MRLGSYTVLIAATLVNLVFAGSYTQTLSGSGLVGYWQFDETSGTTAYDSAHSVTLHSP